MKKIALQELKSVQLNILKSVHSFCRQNNIQYTLAFGTLLGAIRHKGYIPWDDDIDIAMPRNDYEKFIHAYGSQGFYKVYEARMDADYLLPYAKVADERTILVEKTNNRPLGVNVDVFPVDYLSDDIEQSQQELKKMQLLRLIRRVKLLVPNKKMKIYKKWALLFLKCLFLFIPHRWVILKLMDKSMKRKNSPSNYMAIAVCNTVHIMEKRIFSDYVTAQFENCEFSCIKDYDQYLTIEYGDYMTPPPESRRTSPHDLTGAFWK